jgi:hypothetical protein
MESGAYPQPIFFSFPDCGGGNWPIDTSTLTLAAYGTPISANEICPSTSKIQCPTPIIMSAVLPPGLKISFFANTNNNNVKLASRIKEFGRTNLYSNAYASTAHIPDMSTSPLTWYSTNCDGEPGNCHKDTPHPDNCITPTTDYFTEDSDCVINPTTCDRTKNILLRSMVSCNSSAWISFRGINTGQYQSDAQTIWPACQIVANQPVFDEYPNKGQDFCVQNSHATIEKTAYATTWAEPFPPSDEFNCGVTPTGYFQACSCIANQAEAATSNQPKSYDGGITSCGVNYCGMCMVGHDPSIQNFPCICTEDATNIQGSTEKIEINLVNEAGQVVTWEELQVEFCVNGLSVAGVPISRYASGTPACDFLMRQACSNTASLTVNPTLDKQCQCVIEEKVLQEQFVGIDLPSQCFSSLCNINGADVYKTKQQLTGCDSRLCSQVLSIHGTALLAQGVQQVLCNGEVFQVEVLASPGDVPLVSQVVPSYGGFVVGPAIYVSAALLAILFVLCVIWIVRRIRNKRRENAITQREFESTLLGRRE